MSNSLSVKYNPEARFPQVTGDIDDPQLAVMYLGAGAIPQNLGWLSTQTSKFKEALLGKLASTDDLDQILHTLAARIQCMENVNTPEEIAYCEYMASAAYFTDRLELAKQTLLRINPGETTPYVRSLYKALVINNWDASRFKSTISMVHGDSMEWNSERLTLNI
jgi:hypothetical protein